MPARALSAAEVAHEIGRSADWLMARWPDLVARDGFPAPILETGAYRWSAAHVYVWLDRNLPPGQQVAVAAYRAALEAASLSLIQGASAPLLSASEEAAEAEWRGKLEQRFVKV